MVNGNWACFDCRLTVRRPTWRQIAFYRPWLIGEKWDDRVKCPECKNACRFLGPKITVPPKRDKTAWDKLRLAVIDSKLYWNEQSRKQKTKRKHEIEKQIQEIQRRPINDARDRLIKTLRQELAELG